MRRVFPQFQGLSVRVRVTVIVTVLAFGVLGTLGFLQLRSVSGGLTRAAQEQAVTSTVQLARASSGAGPAVLAVIPYTAGGLDGAAVFDKRGRLEAVEGRLGRLLRGLGTDARMVHRHGRMSQRFLQPGKGPVARLTPLSSNKTVQVTIVTTPVGAMAAADHVDWATQRLRASAISTAMSIGGGALFLCFALMLVLGRTISKPLEQLAGEVAHLGDGDLNRPLSKQGAPELRQLARGISTMRADLLRAVQESNTDPLTGVLNHRGFHDALASAAAAAEETDAALSLIAVDLDKLKLINDSFGHGAGDKVIAAVAAAIAGSVRSDDVVARIGGDEFAVICPGAGRAAAESVARDIGNAARGVRLDRIVGPVARESDVRVSVSAGVSDFSAAGRSTEQMALQADAALYAAKGKRTVTAAPLVPAPSPVPAAAAAPVPTLTPMPTPTRLAAVEVSAPKSDDALSQSVSALALALDLRDGPTGRHAVTVSAFAGAVARQLGLPENDARAIERAALLHDGGKMGVRDAVLLKPGPLDEAERREMQEHPVLGYRIATAAGLPEREAKWILHHHEHVDGTGYPFGLSGDEIPIGSRILLVSDAFEAMISDRPYRAGRPQAKALEELRRCAGSQFDPKVVDALVKVLGKTPDATDILRAGARSFVPGEAGSRSAPQPLVEARR